MILEIAITVEQVYTGLNVRLLAEVSVMGAILLTDTVSNAIVAFGEPTATIHAHKTAILTNVINMMATALLANPLTGV